MSKITTEDCAKAVVAAFPAEYGSDNDNWKRFSKSGKKGEPILRVFHHRALPLQALVTEVNGVIVSTTFKGLAPWDVDPESAAAESIGAMYGTNACIDFIRAHDLFPPSDFCFYVCSEEEADGGDTWYILCPLACLKRTGYMYTDQIDYFLLKHLPEGDSEMEEGTFVTDASREETRARLLAIGFVSDAKFEAQMSGATVANEGNSNDE